MRALIIGGAGGMGQGVARDLVKQEQVTDIILADLCPDPERLSKKLRENKKTTLIKMDVNDHALMVNAFKDVSVIINTAGPFYKTAVPVARAAVAAKVNYIDICDDYEGTEILFKSEIDKLAKDTGITILTGMGSDPGTNNVLVKWYADRLDRVDEIYLYWVVSIAELAGAAWDHSLHMTLGEIPQFINGELVYVEGGTGETAEQFLEPLGTCHVCYVGHPQPLTLPKYIKGTKITPYDLALRMWETIPEGRDNGPRSSGLKVIVKGERDGRKVVYTADMVGRMAPGTGLPASTASLMMDAGDVTVKGVVAPEGCINPDKFLGIFLKRGARKPRDFIQGEYPIFLETGKGSRLIDVDGNEFIDFLCGYGPIILGYREEEVDKAVCRQIEEKGFCFTLTQKYQNHLAKKLTEIVPSSEMSIFLKTGSDATTASIRIARAHTNKLKVMRCGYHGWHDWCVEMKGGIPSKFYEDVYEFQYNRLDQLEALMIKHGNETAAIIMTPFGHPNHRKMEIPAPGFLEGARDIADQYGAVLVYDEIRTCFRLSMGGAQKRYGVTPDLTVLGKAMANGYPISVVTGKKDIMTAASDKLFISSTFFPNSDAFVAALKTIEILERDHVLENIWEKGERFMKDIRKLIDKYHVGAELTGVPPMFYITFKKDQTGAYKSKRTDFYTQLIRKGFFFSPYHHAYISFRHTEEDLNLTLKAIEESLAYVKEKY